MQSKSWRHILFKNYFETEKLILKNLFYKMATQKKKKNVFMFQWMFYSLKNKRSIFCAKSKW